LWEAVAFKYNSKYNSLAEAVLDAQSYSVHGGLQYSKSALSLVDVTRAAFTAPKSCWASKSIPCKAIYTSKSHTVVRRRT